MKPISAMTMGEINKEIEEIEKQLGLLKPLEKQARRNPFFKQLSKETKRKPADND